MSNQWLSSSHFGFGFGSSRSHNDPLVAGSDESLLGKIGGKFHRRRINESTGHICHHSLMIICTQCQITIKPPLQLVSYTPPAHRWNISNEIFMKFYEYQMNRLLSQHCRSLLFNNLEKNIPGMGTISGLHGSETLQIQLQHVPCRSGKRFVPLSSNIAVKSPPK